MYKYVFLFQITAITFYYIQVFLWVFQECFEIFFISKSMFFWNLRDILSLFKLIQMGYFPIYVWYISLGYAIELFF